MARHRAWQKAWCAVYPAIPGDSHTPCPNCGSDALRIVFADVGYAAFWCDTCLEGISVCRAVAPEGAAVRDNKEIPNFRLAR